MTVVTPVASFLEASLWCSRAKSDKTLVVGWVKHRAFPQEPVFDSNVKVDLFFNYVNHVFNFIRTYYIQILSDVTELFPNLVLGPKPNQYRIVSQH